METNMSVFIISEIGINHNGDINLAKDLITESKNCGVDAVKFQKRDINVVYSKELLDQPRESPWGKTQRDQKVGLEFGENEYKIIHNHCKTVGIEWFASAWDLNSLDFLKQFNLKYNKIASAMIVDTNFLNEVAKEGKYTFISTGMCSISDIETAVKIFEDNRCEYELMHCISAYPFDDNIANLNMIKFYKEKFNCKVGYSGHEKGGLAVCYAAAALGSSSIERHFTLDRSMYGSDQAASLTPAAFRELVGGIRKIENAIQGKLKKEILDIEAPVAEKLRAHIQ